MIRHDADTGFTDMVLEGSGPNYHYADKRGVEEIMEEFICLPTRPVERDYIPDFSEARRYASLPTSTGLDAMSFEEQVRFIYTVNSFLGTMFHPNGRRDPVTTLVHSALDNTEHRLDDSYSEEAISRAQELFLMPENFSPEALSELRRIADKHRIFQKYREYEYFLDCAGWKRRMIMNGALDETATSPNGLCTNWYHNLRGAFWTSYIDVLWHRG